MEDIEEIVVIINVYEGLTSQELQENATLHEKVKEKQIQNRGETGKRNNLTNKAKEV